MRAVMYAHPWVLRVPISGLPVRPNEVAWFEQALSCLRDTGLTEAEKASVILLVSGYVRNEASTNADIEAAIRASGAAPDEWMSAYGRLLTKLTDPERFPALTQFIASGVFEQFDPPTGSSSSGWTASWTGSATWWPRGPRRGAPPPPEPLADVAARSPRGGPTVPDRARLPTRGGALPPRILPADGGVRHQPDPGPRPRRFGHAAGPRPRRAAGHRCSCPPPGKITVRAWPGTRWPPERGWSSP